MKSTEGGPSEEPPRLAQRLADVTTLMEQIPASVPAAIKLAHTWNGFYNARLARVILDAEAIPRRDAFALAEGWCTEALELLADELGFPLIRRYAPVHAAGPSYLTDMTRAGQIELMLATDTDIDAIAVAMVDLTSAIADALAGVAGDESALPGLRGAARAVTPLAELIWSHYGGDGGDW